MSDYPMLISNKLHSFRNFETANVNDALFFNASVITRPLAILTITHPQKVPQNKEIKFLYYGCKEISTRMVKEV